MNQFCFYNNFLHAAKEVESGKPLCFHLSDSILVDLIHSLHNGMFFLCSMAMKILQGCRCHLFLRKS